MEKELDLHRSSSFSLFLIGWSDTRDIIHYCPYSTALPQNFVHRYRGNKLPQNDETVWLLWSGPAAGASITPGSGCRCSLLGPQTRETNTANTNFVYNVDSPIPRPSETNFPRIIWSHSKMIFGRNPASLNTSSNIFREDNSFPSAMNGSSFSSETATEPRFAKGCSG